MKKTIHKHSYFLGFLGFLGFSGLNNDPIFFLNFAFFGCFAYFWWFKLGSTEDERLIADRYKAGSISFRICFSIAFLLSLFIGQFSLDFELLYKIQLIILSLTFAISVNLWAYLTYKFDLED